MGHDQDGSSDTSQFEWVNTWAAQAKPDAVTAAQPVAKAPTTVKAAGAHAPHFSVSAIPDDQLMRDVAEIERVRDRLAAIPLALPMRRMQALTLVPARTTDPVPVVIGGVLALVMLTVFGAAAAMSKLSR
jgi:hypothetical protein